MVGKWKPSEGSRNDREQKRILVLIVVQSIAIEVREGEKVGDRDEPKFPLFSAPTRVPQLICSNIKGEKGSLFCCVQSRSSEVREAT